KMSIYHPESKLNEEGERTYSIKYIPNGFQVLYDIRDLEVDYLFFPKYISVEDMEQLEDSEYIQSFAYKNIDRDLNAYYIDDYPGMSKLVIKRLYPIFYEKLGYTRERAIEENASFGYFDYFEKAEFKVAIQVLLHDHGVETTIIRDSIVEPSEIKISNISLYPLFGTAIEESPDRVKPGYIVLPDGNGALIEFDNGKYYQNPYRKRLYGQDLSLLPMKMAEEQQKISIPLYGMVKQEAGFAAIITQGDAMANIHADVSGRIDSYNKVYTSFDLRETERVTLGSGFNQYGINLWTKEIVKTDFGVLYRFLSGEDNSYVGIAKSYRDYLIDQGMQQNDTTTQTVLNTEIIGAYDKKEFLLGIPYYTTNAMTTFEQAKKMIDMLLDRGIEHINVTYLGMMNGGLSTGLQNDVKIEKVLGGKKGYAMLKDYLDSMDIPLYTTLNVMTASKYDKLFDQYRYTASRIDGSLSYAFEYHYPTRLPYSETEFTHSADDYVINPLYYEAIYEAFSKDYQGEYISTSYLGSLLAGHYPKGSSFYKQDSLLIQEHILSMMTENLMLENPLGFAIPYADVIVDLPTEATLYSIIDDQIPLLQLALSGLVDYATQSINMSSSRSLEYTFLKVLETGSNIKYTLSFDDSRELLNTEYNYYMLTHFTNWINAIDQQVHEMDALGLHEGELINHERMMPNVYRVTYSQGLVLLINYNLSPQTVGSYTVPAMDYIVIGG
ncbi:MAG TPA: DUF5696 domain-containing protein, partial [Acholeplasmataceae bacterium]|nr:DUF5696 domain-containing protein [Acholeplasmataceae bacterium]